MQKTFKQKLTIGSGLVLVGIIVVYAYFRGYSILYGTHITLVPIIETSHDDTSLITLSGSAKNATSLHVNGREVAVDKQGRFNDPVILLSGYNVTTVEARDKFGNTSKKVLQSYYKPEGVPGVAFGNEN